MDSETSSMTHAKTDPGLGKDFEKARDAMEKMIREYFARSANVGKLEKRLETLRYALKEEKHTEARAASGIGCLCYRLFGDTCEESSFKWSSRDCYKQQVAETGK